MGEEREFSLENFGAGLLAGAALGLLIGVLMAPQSGEATRMQIARRTEEAKLIADELIEQTKKSLEALIERAESLMGLQEKIAWKKIESLREDLKRYDASEA
ncbi:MAG: YtxH domain-containing protein [Actinomycetota bacterium]|nr:YtxH domain-containing protein [Actinomycetota bacterium]